MKLVELLARELKAWPVVDGVEPNYIVQEGDKELYSTTIRPIYIGQKTWHRAPEDHGDECGYFDVITADLAEDWSVAIVTRSDWSAERARIAKPAKKSGKDGWIRHRAGRKCPAEPGVKVDYRMRSKKEAYGERAELLNWGLDNECPASDIMAYRLHKPAEQVEACSKPDPRDSAKRDSDYVCWMRDRITEIDATTHSLTTERAELVQKLASEGLALIGRAVEPFEDYGNIQIGDLVSVISIGGFSDCTGLSVGDIVEVTSVDNDESIKTVSGGSWGSIGYNYKFHSRPSA